MTDRQTERQRDGQTDRQKDRETDRQTDRQADRQTERQKDRQTDRQTDGMLWNCHLLGYRAPLSNVNLPGKTMHASASLSVAVDTWAEVKLDPLSISQSISGRDALGRLECRKFGITTI